MMTPAEAAAELARYQRWRRGDDERTMDAAGIVPRRVGEALDVLLEAHEQMGRLELRAKRLEQELKSAKSQLQKCYRARRTIHLALQKMAAERAE
jgi:hypothetical protein